MEALQIGLAIPLLLFALVGSALAVVASVLGALVLLDAALIAAVATGLFTLVVVVAGKLMDLFASGRGASRK